MTEHKQRSNILGWLLLLVITAVGAYLRFKQLDLKPLHHDEGVNAWLTNELIEKARYKYNPHYYHGPFLYFFTAPFLMALGKTAWALRVPAALLGTLSIPALALVKQRVGWPGVLFAAALMAIAPIDVYFSRTAIHEIYNGTFNLSLVGGILLWWMNGRRWSLYMAAASLGLLFATKETTAITVVALVPAAIATWYFAKPKHYFPGRSPVPEALVAAAPGWWRRNYAEQHNGTALNPGASESAQDIEALTGEQSPLGEADSSKTDSKQPTERPPAVEAAFLRLNQAVDATRAAAAQATIDYATAKAAAKTANVDGPDKLPNAIVDLATPGVLRWRIPLITVVLSFLSELWKRDRAVLKTSLTIFAVILFLLFSSFFTNMKGVGGFFEAFIGWGETGIEGKGHEKVWSYFLEDVLQRYYQPVLYIGLAGLLVGAYFREAFSIFNLVWVVIATIIYSAIPYKTPWCVISFLTPLFYGCAIAVSGIVRWSSTFKEMPLRIATTALPLLVLCAPLYGYAQQSLTLNFEEYDVDDHSIIYVQNIREFMDLVHDMEQLLQVAEEAGTSPDVYMVRAHNPLRFYLLELGTKSWNNSYSESADKKIQKADIVITQRSQAADVKKALTLDKYVKRVYHERPGQKMEVFIKKPLWEQYLAAVKAGNALAPKPRAPTTSFSATRSRELKKQREN